MQLSPSLGSTSVVFDDPNLIVSAGLVPLLALADSVGLSELAQNRLSVPKDKGANAGLKVASLVTGMLAGADSIDDMAVLRLGWSGSSTGCTPRRRWARSYGPSPSGMCASSTPVASRFLTALGHPAPLLLAAAGEQDGKDGRVLVDVDDTIMEVHGYAMQGAGFGYPRVRGLNALLATSTTPGSAPVVVAQRLRKGSASSARGAARMVADALAAVRTMTPAPRLLRADSAYNGHPTVAAAIRVGADASITVRADPRVRGGNAAIDEAAWTPSSTAKRSSTRTPARGSLGPRSPRSASPRSRHKRRPT